MTTVDQLIAAHNEIREGKNIPALAPNALLTEFAINWAQKMVDTGRLRHSRIRDIMALGFRTAGENIAMGQEDADTVIHTWMRSPGHRRNILSRSYTDIGCGYALTDSGRPYWCVCFGTPSG
jgi:uncharacterized protein YkwD